MWLLIISIILMCPFLVMIVGHYMMIITETIKKLPKNELHATTGIIFFMFVLGVMSFIIYVSPDFQTYIKSFTK